VRYIPNLQRKQLGEQSMLRVRRVVTQERKQYDQPASQSGEEDKSYQQVFLGFWIAKLHSTF